MTARFATKTAPVLHPGEGLIRGEHYLPSRPDEVLWGWLPNRATPAVLEVNDGSTVTIDTLSHEGILTDQGRNPESYFAQFGVSEVLADAIDIAASSLTNTDADGPHIVTGPIHVAGARPGDILKVETLDLTRRVPYGLVSNRHGFGALAGEFPEGTDSAATRDTDTMVRGGTVSHFAWVERRDGLDIGLISAGANAMGVSRTVQFPLSPFLGLMGVSPGSDEPIGSVPPGAHGGNIDIKHVGVGSALYLPVNVDGASFYAGDPHFAQGNGEVALTAWEASLRATVRLSIVPASAVGGVVGGATGPVAETATHWIPTGLDKDLNEAMRAAVRNSIAFLHFRFGVPKAVALSYLSAAGDFEVSQVVDSVKGVHCMIRKADWVAWH